MASASFFCAHQRLRTTCPECKPKPAPEPERALAPPPPTGHAPGPRPEDRAAEEADAAAAMTPRGPGKPLMPLRRKANRRISREEAEQAEAWWVRKD